MERAKIKIHKSYYWTDYIEYRGGKKRFVKDPLAYKVCYYLIGGEMLWFGIGEWFNYDRFNSRSSLITYNDGALNGVVTSIEYPERNDEPVYWKPYSKKDV